MAGFGLFFPGIFHSYIHRVPPEGDPPQGLPARKSQWWKIDRPFLVTLQPFRRLNILSVTLITFRQEHNGRWKLLNRKPEKR